MAVKKCSKCKEEKELIEFNKNKVTKDGFNGWCKICTKEYKALHYRANKKQILDRGTIYYNKNKHRFVERDKKYRENNKIKIKEYKKQYYEKNKKQIAENTREKARIYINKRRKTDPMFKLKCNLRTRTWKAFKDNGYSKFSETEHLLGVSFNVAKKHLENQFTKGMSWENQGKWHIDHIIPLASANTEEELINLCHYTNLQPLWAEVNLSKGSSYVPTTTFRL